MLSSVHLAIQKCVVAIENNAASLDKTSSEAERPAKGIWRQIPVYNASCQTYLTRSDPIAQHQSTSIRMSE